MEIDHIIFYCDMHSYISAVQNSTFADLDETLPANRYTKPASLGESVIIYGASPNSIVTSSINLAGSITMDGRCFGT